MFTTNPNDRTVNVKVTRGELCRLLVLITAITEDETWDRSRESWKKLHDKLKTQLAENDWKQEGKND